MSEEKDFEKMIEDIIKRSKNTIHNLCTSYNEPFKKTRINVSIISILIY